MVTLKSNDVVSNQTDSLSKSCMSCKHWSSYEDTPRVGLCNGIRNGRVPKTGFSVIYPKATLLSQSPSKLETTSTFYCSLFEQET